MEKDTIEVVDSGGWERGRSTVVARAGDMAGVAEPDNDSRAVFCFDGEARREAYEDLPGGSSSFLS